MTDRKPQSVTVAPKVIVGIPDPDVIFWSLPVWGEAGEITKEQIDAVNKWHVAWMARYD